LLSSLLGIFDLLLVLLLRGLGPASVDDIIEARQKCGDRGVILLQLPGRERGRSRDRRLLGERAAAQEQPLH